jgi:hypothetical protein
VAVLVRLAAVPASHDQALLLRCPAFGGVTDRQPPKGANLKRRKIVTKRGTLICQTPGELAV